MDGAAGQAELPSEQALWTAWGSGVFAMVSVIEGLRAVSGGVPLIEETASVPWWVDWLAASASAEASAWLMKRAQTVAMRRPVEHLPPWERLGGVPSACSGVAPGGVARAGERRYLC